MKKEYKTLILFGQLCSGIEFHPLAVSTGKFELKVFPNFSITKPSQGDFLLFPSLDEFSTPSSLCYENALHLL